MPLLDHQLVEAVLRLPPEVKSDGGSLKPLLVKALGESLPNIVRGRKDKQSFTFPFDRWLRGELRDGVETILNSMRSDCWLRAEAVSEVWMDYQAGRRHWSRAWALAALAGWRGSRADVH